MARVGVISVLISHLKTKQSFTSGCIRLVKNRFSIQINKFIERNENIAREYMGLLPHGRVIRRRTRTSEVFIMGKLYYSYSEINTFLSGRTDAITKIKDNYKLRFDNCVEGRMVVYIYLDYRIDIEVYQNENYVRVTSGIKDTVHYRSSVPVREDLFSLAIDVILDLKIPDYIKEPILKLRNL